MKERAAISTVGHDRDILKDTLELLSPSLTTTKSTFHEQQFPITTGNALEGRELRDVCSLGEDSGLVHYLKANDAPKPFAGFGSFRQRNGDVLLPCSNESTTKKGMACEAPAKLGTGLSKSDSDQHLYSAAHRVVSGSSLSNTTRSQFLSEPIDIKDHQAIRETQLFKRLQKQRSFSSDIDRDEAWERKRDLFLVDELRDLDDDKKSRNVGRSASDCGDRTWPRPLKGRSRARTRSLTDEDLEELRGCIDLGFGFNYDESCDLRSTLPALDLYCAINRQYNDMRSRSSPVSPLDGSNSLERSSSVDSPGSPLTDTWRISSPGDHPNQVKTRLRHWAQAVACSIRQGSF